MVLLFKDFVLVSQWERGKYIELARKAKVIVQSSTQLVFIEINALATFHDTQHLDIQNWSWIILLKLDSITRKIANVSHWYVTAETQTAFRLFMLLNYDWLLTLMLAKTGLDCIDAADS